MTENTRFGVRPSTWRKIAVELTLVVGFLYVYELIRGLVVQSGGVAARHALLVVDVEKALGLFQERSFQSVFLHARWLIQGFNLYYGATHFLIPAGVLIWLGVRHTEHYARARTVLMVTTAVGFVFFWLYPVAPPRLLPAHFEIVDTIRHLDDTHTVASLMDRAGNAYAAMPSLHMAWAVWCTLAIYPVLRARWSRIVAIAYPILTAIVVVSTGNHFITDCVAGAALVLSVAWALERLPSRLPTFGRRPSPLPVEVAAQDPSS